MIRPPHPLLAPLWREADAVVGALHVPRRSEQAVAALTANPVAPFADLAAIAWAFAAPGGEAAIAQSLARLRGANAAPMPRRAPPGPSPGRDRGFGGSPNLLPADAPGGLSRARYASLRAPTWNGATGAAATTTELPHPPASARDAVPVFAEAARRAARWPIGGAASAAAQRAIGLILNGLRPSAAALLGAIDIAADEPPAPASPPIAARIDRALTASLSQVDAARGARTGGVGDPASFEPTRPGFSATPAPPASGFRRLAALFAQPAAGSGADPVAGADGVTPAFHAAAPAGAAARRKPAPVFPQTAPPEAAASRFSPARHLGEDVVAETEMAELLARVLRREARRQGIADEGGAA